MSSKTITKNDLKTILDNVLPVEGSTSIPTINKTAKFDSAAHMNSSDMSSQDVNNFVNSLNISGTNLIDFFYPVGSYYETSDGSFDPNIAWGGTWTPLGEGVVLMSGGGSSYAVGTTYGGNTKNYTPAGSVSVTVATHAITVAEMPSHNHGEKSLTAYFSGRRCGNDSVSHWGGTNTSITASSTAVTTSTGTGTSNKHQDIVNINMTHTHTSNGSGSAHGHPNSTGKFTGTQATINVMQASLATYIWHRTA